MDHYLIAISKCRTILAHALLDTTYDGVEITAQNRVSDRWQMLFGFSAGPNEGGLSIGDFNDPNQLHVNLTTGFSAHFTRVATAS
jgi:hypothetical protein